MVTAVAMMSILVLTGVPKACSECVEIPDYYASLQSVPHGTVSVDEVVTLMCSTNIPSPYPSEWEINGQNYQITRPPPGFTTDGLNLTFTFQTTVRARCLFRINLGGSVGDICSNIATIVPLAIYSGVSIGCSHHGRQVASNSNCQLTAATNSMLSSVTPLPQSLRTTAVTALSSMTPLHVPTITFSTPERSSHMNYIIIGVSVFVAVVLHILVLLMAAVAIWIYCHHKNKDSSNNKGHHVYEEVACSSSKDPVLHHNPAYEQPKRLKMQENPSYVSTNIPLNPMPLV